MYLRMRASARVVPIDSAYRSDERVVASARPEPARDVVAWLSEWSPTRAVNLSSLQRVAQGDETALRDCLRVHGPLVWSLARRMSTTAQDAEDAVQEIFLDLWRSAARFDPTTASETTFVAMIARRRLIDRRRKVARRVSTDPIADDAPDVPQAPRAEICAEAGIAAKALEGLRPDQRKVLVMSACEGLSHDEIATATGMPLGTVKAHARRGLIRVRDLLLGRDGEGDDR